MRVCATTRTSGPVPGLHAQCEWQGRDNGHGVPDEIATNIFVPFFTTREGGSGVGLALARQVMIAHGGFIRLGQKSDGGATFTLTF